MGLPRKVERVQWDAVAAKARTWIEWLETEWFCLCRLDHFPYIDAHTVEKYLEFIHKGNVYGTVDVFEQFCGFCHLC